MEAEVRDICRPLTQAILLPANGIGSMSRGAARAILDIAGPELQDFIETLVFERDKPFEAGDFFATPSYKMARRGVKRIYHAVTMKYPGGSASLTDVNKAVRSALDRAVKDGVESIAITGIGIRDGRLDAGSVARMLVQISRSYCDRLQIKFADKDKEFIYEVEQMLG